MDPIQRRFWRPAVRPAKKVQEIIPEKVKALPQKQQEYITRVFSNYGESSLPIRWKRRWILSMSMLRASGSADRRATEPGGKITECR